MMRDVIIREVEDTKVVAIVRGVYGQDCINLANALYHGGIRLLEVTFDQSGNIPLTKTSETIYRLTQALGDKMVFGAGTVTSMEMLDLAMDAGAKFIVSPNVNEAIIKATVAAGLVSMPGAMTPTEVQAAYEYGADFVKVFPAGTLGTSYLKAIRGPINHVRLLAVGGINEKNAIDFLKAGACGVGVGGNLVNKDWIAEGAFDKITSLARALVENVSHV